MVVGWTLLITVWLTFVVGWSLLIYCWLVLIDYCLTHICYWLVLIDYCLIHVYCWFVLIDLLLVGPDWLLFHSHWLLIRPYWWLFDPHLLLIGIYRLLFRLYFSFFLIWLRSTLRGICFLISQMHYLPRFRHAITWTNFIKYILWYKHVYNYCIHIYEMTFIQDCFSFRHYTIIYSVDIFMSIHNVCPAVILMQIYLPWLGIRRGEFHAHIQVV